MGLHRQELALDGAALAGQEAGADAIGDRAEPQVEARRLHLGRIDGCIAGMDLLAGDQRMQRLAR